MTKFTITYLNARGMTKRLVAQQWILKGMLADLNTWGCLVLSVKRTG